MLRSVYHLATGFALRLPLGSGSLAAALGGRRDSAARWLRWARTERGTGKVLWIHSASVGEALTAAPVVCRLRTIAPEIRVVHSYSSSSAADWPAPFERAYADFCPLDLPSHISRVLDAVEPILIVFARGDLWPEFLFQAANRKIPMTIIGGSVRPTSLRLRPVVSRLTASTIGKLCWVGAATHGDADRWCKLGVPHDRIDVTGDPRHDQVLERVTEFSRIRGLCGWATQGATLVAGSVEPSDEAILFRATSAVFAERPQAQLIVAPHSPEGPHVTRLARLAARYGIEAEVWNPRSRNPPRARCLILDARGLLFDLYVLASFVYVGGGYQPGKLHATIEPAAYGLPLLVGPQWEGIPDAKTLVESGGAVGLPAHGSVAALVSQWLLWLDDEEGARRAGMAARRCLTQGAAERTALRLSRLLADTPTVRGSLPRK